jgi:CMP-N,N'-diacetyllegionaminic acid synthase
MKFSKKYIIKNQTWVFIPARAGSKKIKNKNIKKLNNFPLIYYSLNTAKKLKFIKKIVFSSDSAKYHKIANKYATIESHFRSSKTSKDYSTDYEVFKEYVANKIKNKEKIPEFFLHLRPTTPLREIKTLKKIYNYFLKNKKKFSSLRSVTELENPGYRTVIIKKKKLYSLFLKSFHLDQINKARQLFAKTFIPNGYGDIIKTENIFKGFIHGKSVGYFVNNEFNSDIDNIDEFKSTERFLRQFL